MTNYEKIKQMSIDEMVEYLLKITADLCEACPLERLCSNELNSCNLTVKYWLESEADNE